VIMTLLGFLYQRNIDLRSIRLCICLLHFAISNNCNEIEKCLKNSNIFSLVFSRMTSTPGIYDVVRGRTQLVENQINNSTSGPFSACDQLQSRELNPKFAFIRSNTCVHRGSSMIIVRQWQTLQGTEYNIS
jgi:hypothetical protein